MSITTKSKEEYYEIISKIVLTLSKELGMDNDGISEFLGLTIEEVEELNIIKERLN